MYLYMSPTSHQLPSRTQPIYVRHRLEQPPVPLPVALRLELILKYEHVSICFPIFFPLRFCSTPGPRRLNVKTFQDHVSINIMKPSVLQHHIPQLKTCSSFFFPFLRRIIVCLSAQDLEHWGKWQDPQNQPKIRPATGVAYGCWYRDRRLLRRSLERSATPDPALKAACLPDNWRILRRLVRWDVTLQIFCLPTASPKDTCGDIFQPFSELWWKFMHFASLFPKKTFGTKAWKFLWPLLDRRWKLFWTGSHRSGSSRGFGLQVLGSDLDGVCRC